MPLTSAVNAEKPLIRLVAAGAIVAVAVLALWQAGVLFPKDNATIETPGGGTAEIFAAATDIDTPPFENRAVGLDEGDIAPDFEFSTFDGERKRLSDYRGQPVFLNFWASWCGPCRQEMPDMMTMIEKYGDRGLVVIAMNNGEAVGPAQRFIDNIEVELTEFGYDPNSSVARRYNVPGLPVSYFIDSDGVITRVLNLLPFNVMESSVLESIAGHKALANSAFSSLLSASNGPSSLLAGPTSICQPAAAAKQSAISAMPAMVHRRFVAARLSRGTRDCFAAPAGSQSVGRPLSYRSRAWLLAVEELACRLQRCEALWPPVVSNGDGDEEKRQVVRPSA